MTSGDKIVQSNASLSFLELSPVLSVYFLGFFVFRGIFTNFPIYIQITQQLSDVETVDIWAIISGVALLVGALTRLPAGLLSDKIGRIKSFSLAYLVYLIALILILLTSNNILYIIGMSLVRFGLNSIAMSGRAVVSTANRDRAFKNGLLSSAVGLGGFAGPYLMGYILENYSPPTFLWVTIALILIDILLFITLYGGVNYFWKTKNHEQDLSYERVSADERIDYLEALKSNEVWQMFFLFLSAGTIYGLISSIYSIYGFNILSFSPSFIGLITGLGSLIQMVWAPITGRLYEYLKDEVLRVFAWLLILIASIIASLSAFGGIFFIISFILLNFGNATYFPMEITRMSKITGGNQFSFIFGIATSLIILGTSLAGFISPLLYRVIPEMNFYVSVVLAGSSMLMVIAQKISSN